MDVTRFCSPDREAILKPFRIYINGVQHVGASDGMTLVCAAGECANETPLSIRNGLDLMLRQSPESHAVVSVRALREWCTDPPANCPHCKREWPEAPILNGTHSPGFIGPCVADRRRLRHFLEWLKSDEVVIGFQGEYDPIRFEAPGVLALIMPMASGAVSENTPRFDLVRP